MNKTECLGNINETQNKLNVTIKWEIPQMCRAVDSTSCDSVEHNFSYFSKQFTVAHLNFIRDAFL